MFKHTLFAEITESVSLDADFRFSAEFQSTIIEILPILFPFFLRAEKTRESTRHICFSIFRCCFGKATFSMGISPDQASLYATCSLTCPSFIPIQIRKYLAKRFSCRGYSLVFSDLLRDWKKVIEIRKEQEAAPFQEKILISGSHGLIGGALYRFFVASGYTVLRLVRLQDKPDERSVRWDPQTGTLLDDLEKIEGLCACFHFAAKSLLEQIYSKKGLQEAKESRVEHTKKLGHLFFNLQNPPKAVFVASASGIYGEVRKEFLYESSLPGKDALSELSLAWEEASTYMAKEGKISSLTIIRLGVVLAAQGGFLKTLLTPFHFLGGMSFGSNQTHLPWIHLRDVTLAVYYILKNKLDGVYNFVAPQEGKEVTQTLLKILGKPYYGSIPSFLIRKVFPPLIQSILLTNLKIVPDKLLKQRYQFEHSDLKKALQTEAARYHFEKLLSNR